MFKQIIISLSLAFSLTGCADQNPTKEEIPNPDPIAEKPAIEKEIETPKPEEKEVVVTPKQPNTETIGGINKDSGLEDFKGKPSVIMIVGTYCGHCQRSVPSFEEEIWKNYHEQANLWVNVIDGKYFAVYDVAQGLNRNLSYQGITGEECGYIPSWVLLDKEGVVVMSSCGNKKSMTEMEEALKELI